MDKSIKVSVIIPVYNVEKYLEACLESVIGQTLSAIEIICINDGSTDGSPEILTQYAARDGRIAVKNQLNKGLSSARNLGLRLAHGEYIYFLDGDDYIAVDALAILYNEAVARNLEVLRLSSTTIYEKSYSAHARIFKFSGDYSSIVSGQDLFTAMIFNDEYHVPVWLYFINRKYLETVQLSFIDGIIHEDNHFTFMLIIQANQIGCLDKVLHYYRIRPGSIMEMPESIINLDGYCRILKTNLKYIFEHSFSNSNTQIALGSYISRSLENCQNLYEKLAVEDPLALKQYLDNLSDDNLEQYHFIEKVIENNINLKIRYNIEKSFSFKLGNKIVLWARRLLFWSDKH